MLLNNDKLSEFINCTKEHVQSKVFLKYFKITSIFATLALIIGANIGMRFHTFTADAIDFIFSSTSVAIAAYLSDTYFRIAFIWINNSILLVLPFIALYYIILFKHRDSTENIQSNFVLNGIIVYFNFILIYNIFIIGIVSGYVIDKFSIVAPVIMFGPHGILEIPCVYIGIIFITSLAKRYANDYKGFKKIMSVYLPISIFILGIAAIIEIVITPLIIKFLLLQ